jgi:hypothetical protein
VTAKTDEESFMEPNPKDGSRVVVERISVEYMKMPDDDKISTQDEFVSFVEFLIADYRENFQNWGNATFWSYLDAIGGWIGDMDGYYKNRGMPNVDPKQLKWHKLADILLGAATDIRKAESIGDVDVRSRDNFVTLIEFLIAHREDVRILNNITIVDYLRSVLELADGVVWRDGKMAANAGLEKMHWRVLGNILHAAKYYE